MKKNHLIVAALFLLLGWSLQKLDFHQLQAEAEERYTDLQTFTKVLNLVQQNYVEPVDSRKLLMGSIKGMLRELDPHTLHLPAEAFKDFETETSGEFGGIGIEISVQKGYLTVISPIEDTPAWDAGVKAGDKILAVNGTSTKNLSLAEASQLMKGPRGSRVKMLLLREGQDEPITIEIVRANVKIKSVKPLALEDGIHYVRITSFIENTGRDLERYLSGKKIRGLILDLRKNPGGLLNQAIAVSDLFLKEGVIVSTIGRKPESKEVTSASKKGLLTDFPMIVLINEYSASASEIVAGALQDNKRALVLGKKSFGKGSVQQVIRLGDGSGLKLTVARYYTPSGKSIQADGIQPDVEVEEIDMEKMSLKNSGANVLRERDMVGHLEGDVEKEENKKKTQSPAAVNWLKEMTGKKSEAKSPLEKMMTSDYQFYQAVSYLRAWKVMKEIR